MRKYIALLSISLSLYAIDTNYNVEYDDKGQAIHTQTDVIRGSIGTRGIKEDRELLKSAEVRARLQEAYRQGYQAGAEYAMKDMNYRLKAMENFMDSIFAFHRLYLEGKYQPPLIGVVNSPVEVSKDGQTMSIQSRSFTVLQPGYFVNEPKTWKNFLLNGVK